MTQAGRGWSTASKTMDLTSSGSSQIPVFTDVALPSAYLALHAAKSTEPFLVKASSL